jgi:hypothetical protein
MAMTNEEFNKLVKDFYERNKYFHLIDVIAATPEHHECQVCGNKHLKKLCHIRNEERGEEWYIGWECWNAVETLQEQEEKIRFKEIVKCSRCGEESLRGTLLKSARNDGLCNNCWREEHGMLPPELQQCILKGEVKCQPI